MIDPHALVDPSAEIGAGVEIGPFTVIGPGVSIGAGTRIGPHAVIKGPTRIGERNRIFQFASIGAEPQDKKYRGEPTSVEIGDGNTIREYVTINRGTAQDAGVTRVGDDNWIMAYVHFAHDCQVGSHVIVANACELAGHVHVGDWAILGATTLVHQFVHIGVHSFTGMGTYLPQDLPPYVTVAGNPAKPYGINSEGLKRRGFAPATINEIKRAYRTLYRSKLPLEEARSQLQAQAATCAEIVPLVEFLASSTRGLLR